MNNILNFPRRMDKESYSQKERERVKIIYKKSGSYVCTVQHQPNQTHHISLISETSFDFIFFSTPLWRIYSFLFINNTYFCIFRYEAKSPERNRYFNRKQNFKLRYFSVSKCMSTEDGPLFLRNYFIFCFFF